MASTPADIFAIAEEEEKNNSDYKNFDRVAVFVGEKSSGKTALINLLRGTQKDEGAKATYAMEYSSSKRTVNNRKEVVHFYELGGGKELADLAAVPLTKESYKNIVYIVVVDLSDPANLIESLEFWLKTIRNFSDNFFRDLKGSPTKADNYIKTAATLEEHEDKNKVQPLGVQTIIVGSKYDQYEEFDSENRKWISRMIRYISHLNGCSLFYSSVANQKLSLQIRTLLNNFLFSSTLANHMHKDYAKPLFITFGADSVDTMGIPTSGNMSAYDVLKKMSRDYFPAEKSKNPQKEIAALDLSKFPEAKIDSTKLEKDHELERLHKANKNESPVSSDKAERAAYTSMNEDEDGPRSRRGPGSNPPAINKAQFGGLSSDNLRPTAGPVKKMRPTMNRGPTGDI